MRSRSLLVLALACVAGAPPSADAAVRHHSCRDAPAGTRCGSIRVPLDRSGATPGRLRIEFEGYPRCSLPDPEE
jgi:hypothetical protein